MSSCLCLLRSVQRLKQTLLSKVIIQSPVSWCRLKKWRTGLLLPRVRRLLGWTTNHRCQLEDLDGESFY